MTATPIVLSLDGVETVYGLVFSGNEFEPRFSDGDTLIFDKSQPVTQGNTVAVWLRPELVKAGRSQVSVYRVQTPLPPSLELPLNLAEGSEICPVLIVEGVKPAALAALPANRLLGVHRLVSVVRREDETAGGQS